MKSKGNVYSGKARMKITQALLNGDSVSKVSEKTGVSVASLYNWQRRATEQGIESLADMQRGRAPLLSDAELNDLKKFIQSKKNIDENDVFKYLGQKHEGMLTKATARILINRLGFTSRRILVPARA